MQFFYGPAWGLVIVGLLLGLYAQAKIRMVFNKYSKVLSANNISGAQAARQILNAYNLSDINIEEITGKLTDHYDPEKRVLKLSNDVYNSRSLAALGVAAHEAGHTIQHAQKYLPLMLRTGIFPFVALGSYAWLFLFLFGLMFHNPLLMNVGILLFGGIVLFQIITLPVEFNASSRALALLTSQGIINESETGATKSVLNAAALTYVAATLMAIFQLVRLILLRRR